MPQVDFRSPRLFIDAPLAPAINVPLDRDHINYLGNVLRLGAGDGVLVFNGRDGEWRTSIAGRKRPEHLIVEACIRAQDRLPDIAYIFAPLKHARLDYLTQKAVEMGAARLQPVITRFTQTSRVNIERMRANVIEAAEQCGILSVATVDDPIPLERYLTLRDEERLLIFCDEKAKVTNPVAALEGCRNHIGRGLDVLVGPEGGFSEEEGILLRRQSKVLTLALGPRILRADTAAVAALALIQSILGDWPTPQS
jgi:16S rRNA (uracil1498-N3)-methyltransferase